MMEQPASPEQPIMIDADDLEALAIVSGGLGLQRGEFTICISNESGSNVFTLKHLIDSIAEKADS